MVLSDALAVYSFAIHYNFDIVNIVDIVDIVDMVNIIDNVDIVNKWRSNPGAEPGRGRQMPPGRRPLSVELRLSRNSF